MSCNHCATASTGAAATTGAPDIEANWAANRQHPQYCPTCHAFLRADGGCTRCDGRTGVGSYAGTLAMTGPVVGTPPRRACGHAHTTGAGEGAEVWCTECDDWTTVIPPEPPPVVASPAEPQTVYGRAAFDAQHDQAKRPVAQGKVKEIGDRLALALQSVGVPGGVAAPKIYNMVWQYLDRCPACKAWISNKTPQCRNPRCGRKGETVGTARPWPPGGVAWVQSQQDVGFEVGHPATPHPVPPRKAKAAKAVSAAATPPAAPAPTPPAATTPPAAQQPWNLSVADIDQFIEDVDAELKRRAQPELSDAEAADWHEAVSLATGQGHSFQAGLVANGVSLARSEQAKLKALLAEAAARLEQTGAAPLTAWEKEELRQTYQRRANVRWLKKEPAETRPPESVAAVAGSLRDLRITDLFNKVDRSFPTFNALTPQERTTWRGYAEAVSRRGHADPEQLRDLIHAARQSGRPMAEAAYEAELNVWAKDYGLTANDVLGVELADQVASGETPAELVERSAEKFDLTRND